MTCETCGSDLIVHGDCLACNRPLAAHGPIPADLLTPAMRMAPLADRLDTEGIVVVSPVGAAPALVGLA